MEQSQNYTAPASALVMTLCILPLQSLTADLLTANNRTILTMRNVAATVSLPASCKLSLMVQEHFKFSRASTGPAPAVYLLWRFPCPGDVSCGCLQIFFTDKPERHAGAMSTGTGGTTLRLPACLDL